MSMSNATQGRVGPRNLPPFRADHVGSLLRPRELVEARAARKAGTLSAEALRAVEDRCIEAAIRKQEELGLRAATDGEYRRAFWHFDFVSGLEASSCTSRSRRSSSRAACRCRLRCVSPARSAGASRSWSTTSASSRAT